MIDNINKIVIDIVRKSSRFLIRDFYELDSHHVGVSNGTEFTNKAFDKVKSELDNALKKYFPHIFYSSDIKDEICLHQPVILIDLTDGANNFARSLPFFSISIVIYKSYTDKATPDSVIFYFPIIKEIFYLQRNRGVWLEKISNSNSGLRRLKHQKDYLPPKPYVATNIPSILQDFSSYFQIMQFNCFSFEFCLLLLGKIDAVITIDRFSISQILPCFLTEVGLKFNKGKFMIIATNDKLLEKIKEQE